MSLKWRLHAPEKAGGARVSREDLNPATCVIEPRHLRGSFTANRKIGWSGAPARRGAAGSWPGGDWFEYGWANQAG